MAFQITLTGKDAEQWIKEKYGTPTPGKPVETEEIVKAAAEALEPETETPTEEEPTNVKKFPSPEEQAEAEEPPPEPATPGEENLLESGAVDDLRARFEELVANDFDKALEIIDGLGVENFSQAIGAGKAEELAGELAKLA